METQTKSNSLSNEAIFVNLVIIGIFSLSNIGGPISTSTSQLDIHKLKIQAQDSTLTLSLVFTKDLFSKYFIKHLIPLPHISATLQSELNIVYLYCALPDFSIINIQSDQIQKRLLHILEISFFVKLIQSKSLLRLSNKIKSFHVHSSLVKGIFFIF